MLPPTPPPPAPYMPQCSIRGLRYVLTTEMLLGGVSIQ